MQLQEEEFSKHLDLGVWKKLLHFIAPYRRYLLILIIQMVLLGLVDALVPIFNKYVIDNIALTGQIEKLLPFGLLDLVVMVL